jgi:hypothetical protein
MNKICVYTANINNYNEHPRWPDIPGIDFVTFNQAPNPGETPRMASKRYKMLPHVYLPEYEQTIWVDTTVRIISPTFVEEALACIEFTGMALWKHPDRDCLYQEAAVSIGMPKYAHEPLLHQAAAYHDAGMPAHWGLWAAGIMARRNDDSTVRALMGSWWAEILQWGIQDQVSLPYCLWKSGWRPAEFPDGLYNNRWVGISAHNPNW